jgi:hypothetical protein
MKSALKYALVLVMSSAALAQVKGKISGMVVDDRGAPVPHMVLEYEQLGGRWMHSGQVPMTETDANGRFSIDVYVQRLNDGTIEGGRWAVSPHVDLLNKNNYYLNHFNRFYHVGHSPEITVTPESPNAVVEVKLDPKGGALMGKITDAVTGAPIRDYHMELAWTSDPTRGLGGGMDSSYRWLLPPDTGITLKIQAKGYQSQEYKNITVSSGQDKALDIQLQPEGK